MGLEESISATNHAGVITALIAKFSLTRVRIPYKNPFNTRPNLEARLLRLFPWLGFSLLIEKPCLQNAREN